MQESNHPGVSANAHHSGDFAPKPGEIPRSGLLRMRLFALPGYLFTPFFSRVFASLPAFEWLDGFDLFLPRPQHQVATWDTLASGAMIVL
jgi:hypothetical protein